MNPDHSQDSELLAIDKNTEEQLMPKPAVPPMDPTNPLVADAQGSSFTNFIEAIGVNIANVISSFAEAFIQAFGSSF